jgi:hypothetical protein
MVLRKTENFMSDLGKLVDRVAVEYYGRRMGFAILIFDGESQGGDYISNCPRAEMIKVLRETADRIEGNEDIGSVIGEA